MTHTEFGLIRHGLTPWNIERRIQGQTNISLSDTGIAQASDWGTALAAQGWSRIVCSDLNRAMQTATIINKQLGSLPMTTDNRLREQHWGKWEGHQLVQLGEAEQEEMERQKAAGWGFTPAGGESRLCVLHRTLDALRDCAERHPGERILVVTHLGCMKAVADHLTELRTGQPTQVKDPELTGKYHIHHIRCVQGDLSDIELNVPL
jgi:probable phosphoglycerate mutase